MKILVTGTAGFIGYHLAKKLLERGDEVVGLDNINDYYDVNLKHARLAELEIDRNEVESNNSKLNIKNSVLLMDTDASGLMNDFNYKPDTKLARGISEFVKWYREFYGDNI